MSRILDGQRVTPRCERAGLAAVAVVGCGGVVLLAALCACAAAWVR